MSPSRREFMVGCSTAVAAMAGGRVGNLVFANANEAPTGADELLVVVFLRGGCDGLSLVTPYDDPTYVTKRGGIAIPGSGANGAINLTTNNTSFTSSLGLHARATPLKELYDSNKLAIVHACGLNNDTRSHFEAMDFMERGTPDNKNTPTGWITRHLESANVTGLIPAISASSSTPAALLSDSNAVAMTSASSFTLNTHWRYSSDALANSMIGAVSQMYTGGTSLAQIAGQRTVEVIQSLQGENLNYTPTAGVSYPTNSFGDTLKLVAQMMKLDVGLRIATVDFGGWDTHENQGNTGAGYFGNQVDTLSRGLHAFYNDVVAFQNRVTVVVMSEFGRRLGVNSSGGTDHGHGNAMLVLGGNVNGGKVYGNWPGLDDLDQNQDLKITTDYRTILSEILIRRLANPQLGVVFPGLSSYQPLGVVSGPDLQPVFSTQNKIYVPLLNR